MAQGKLKVKAKVPKNAKTKNKQKGSAVTKRNSEFFIIIAFKNIIIFSVQIVQFNLRKTSMKKLKS